MDTPGRIVATPDALDFTVENVEKVSFYFYFYFFLDLSSSHQLSSYSTDLVWRDDAHVFAYRN